MHSVSWTKYTSAALTRRVARFLQLRLIREALYALKEDEDPVADDAVQLFLALQVTCERGIQGGAVPFRRQAISRHRLYVRTGGETRVEG